MKVKSLDSRELQYIFKMTKLIHRDRSAARVLAAVTKKSLSAQQISKVCDIPLPKCYSIIKKLEEHGFITIAKQLASKEDPDKVDYFYKAQLNPNYVRFENGRFKVTFPAVLSLSNGNEIDLKSFLKSYLV
jgi:hypothetical protein